MIKKYLPQVLFRTGVSVAIRTGILYEIRKYFINENDLRIWGKNSKHKVVLRHHFISPSKGVNFLKAKPTCLLFLSLPRSSHGFGGGSQHGPSIQSLPSVSKIVSWITVRNSCPDFSFTNTDWIITWIYSILLELSLRRARNIFDAASCCPPVFRKSHYQTLRVWYVKSIICHRVGSYDKMWVLASLIPCPAQSCYLPALSFCLSLGLLRLSFKVKEKEISSLSCNFCCPCVEWQTTHSNVQLLSIVPSLP